MRLLELVMQGVPGSAAQGRIPVGQGVTVIVPGAAGAVPLARVVRFTLYDEGVEPPADLRAASADAVRVGLTLQDPAGTVYRVVRDLVSGASQLLRYEAAEKRFTPVSSRPSEMGQYLRSQARVPGEDVFRDLFTFSRADLPSGRPSAAPPEGGETTFRPFGGRTARRPAGGAGGIHGLGMNAAAVGRTRTPAASPLASSAGWKDLLDDEGPASDAYGHLSLEEKRARRDELTALKATLDEVDKVQFHLDGLNAKVFELDEALRRVRRLEDEVRALEAHAASFGDLGALPEDFESRVKEYAYLAERLEKTLGRIEGERDTISERLALPPELPWRNRILLGGLAGTLLVTAGAFALDGMRWLALLNPLGLGAAAFVLIQWIGERERYDDDAGRTEGLEERAKEAQKRFEIETALVRRVMKELGVDTPEKILERYAARKEADARLEDARARLAESTGDEAFKSLEAEHARLGAEIAETERRLASASIGGQDAGDLKREIDALTAAIEREERGEPAREAAPEPSGAAARDAFDGPAEDASDVPDPTPGLLERLADVLQLPVDEVFAAVAPRLAQYVAALTDRTYGSAALVGRGLVVRRTSGGDVPWAALGLADQDRVYRALRLAFAEAAVKAEPQPLLFDGFLDDLPPAQRPLAAKMLRFIAQGTQVVLQGADPAWASIAQAVHRL